MASPKRTESPRSEAAWRKGHVTTAAAGGQGRTATGEKKNWGKYMHLLIHFNSV